MAKQFVNLDALHELAESNADIASGFAIAIFMTVTDVMNVARFINIGLDLDEAAGILIQIDEEFPELGINLERLYGLIREVARHSPRTVLIARVAIMLRDGTWRRDIAVLTMSPTAERDELLEAIEAEATMPEVEFVKVLDIDFVEPGMPNYDLILDALGMG